MRLYVVAFYAPVSHWQGGVRSKRCQLHEMQWKQLQAQQLSRQQRPIQGGWHPPCMLPVECSSPPAFASIDDRCSDRQPAHINFLDCEQWHCYNALDSRSLIWNSIESDTESTHLHPKLIGASVALQEIVRAPANGVQRVPQLPCSTQLIPKLYHVPCQNRHTKGHRQVKLYIVSSIIISPT